METTELATRELCLYCFDVLASHLNHDSAAQVMDRSHTIPEDAHPLFVTWYTYRTANKIYQDKRLRGCIGNFSGLSLRSGLREYAVISAMRDSRFQPIQPHEFPNLACGVSILTQFEKAESYLDWEIGTHGIWIEFKINGIKRTATYLPEIAQEQGWTREETIESLLRKGGVQGPVTHQVKQDIVLTRYQSTKHVVTFQDMPDKRKRETHSENLHACFIKPFSHEPTLIHTAQQGPVGSNASTLASPWCLPLYTFDATRSSSSSSSS